MKKKRKIDFILKENNHYKIIFRFYPRSSTCHSFNDEPPKSWKEVYKVYYYYKIIKIYKDEERGFYHQILFDSGYDECSAIDEVAARCKHLAEDKEMVVKEVNGKKYFVELLNKEIITYGEGVFWTIKKSGRYFIFYMFSYDNIGFRFYLSKEQTKEFGEYLDYCCEYMLANGDPI